MSGSPSKRYGTELILDLYDCDPKTIRSKTQIATFTRRLCQLINMKRYGEPLIAHFGHANPLTSGYSVVQLIETSSITGHFSEATNNAYLNIFSCQPFDAHAAAEFCRAYFGAREMKRRLLVRR